MRILLTTLGLLVLLLFSTVASAKILFKSTPDGVRGIYVMDDDGSNVTLLTDTLRPGMPKWSTEGKQIVFQRRARSKFGDIALFLMNADGTNVRQLTEPTSRDTIPCFSPDGKNIVFDREERIDNNQQATWSVCVLNLETGKIKKIHDGTAASLDWSPDGRQIVFSTALNLDASGNSIYIMGSNGDNVREVLSPPPAGAWLNIARWSPTWSQDGKQILYTQTEFTWEERKPDVISLIRMAHRYIICDRNGKTLKQLNIPKNLRPAGIDWMDNGKSIVFSASVYALNEPPPPWQEAPPKNIYKYRIATGKLTKLTHSASPWWDNAAPDWIDDRVLSVHPAGKKPVRWGELKKALRTQGAAFKTLSQSMLLFLQNQRGTN